MTALAVILLGLYLIFESQQHLASTLTLVWGIVVVLLVLVDVGPTITGAYGSRR